MEENPKEKPPGGVQTIPAADEAKREHYAMLLKRFPGNDVNTQRTRLYLALQFAPITTFDARKFLDIYHPNARKRELILQGLRIDTLRVALKTDAGVIHRRIGLYVFAIGERVR